jgi:circadian clock protein KaiB
MKSSPPELPDDGESPASPELDAPPDAARYVLRLYVTGKTPNSLRAIASLKEICEEHLQGRYHLQVIDIYQQPDLAEADQIVATPTLIKKLPAPLRRLIGDMSNRERVLVGLDLRPLPEVP